MCFLEMNEVSRTPGTQLSIPFVDLWLVDLDAELLREFPPGFLRKLRLLPIARQNGALRVATADPYDISGFDKLRIQTGLKIVPELAREKTILYFLRIHLGNPGLDASE